MNRIVLILDYINQLGLIIDLVNHVYLSDLLLQATTDTLAFCRQCLLTTLNTIVAELNSLIIRQLPG